jgi:thermostable 8-oxoguanine DNA glycosylase
MKLLWKIEDADVRKVKKFYDENKNNGLVLWRWERNVESGFSRFSRDVFWKEMVVCLLTTQARAGPNSAVSRFASQKPFPLRYRECREQRNLKSFAQRTMADFGGIRRNVTVSQQIRDNFRWLEKHGGWEEVNEIIRETRKNPKLEMETKAADFIDHHLKGFGPKQSRNLLQGLGLTKYEVPIDSRITRWLNNFGFPVTLSATALSDLDYYKFVSEGFRELCNACNIYPCMLDAAIFSSFDAR